VWCWRALMIAAVVCWRGRTPTPRPEEHPILGIPTYPDPHPDPERERETARDGGASRRSCTPSDTATRASAGCFGGAAAVSPPREMRRRARVLRSKGWVAAAPWAGVCRVPPPLRCSFRTSQQVMVRGQSVGRTRRAARGRERRRRPVFLVVVGPCAPAAKRGHSVVGTYPWRRFLRRAARKVSGRTERVHSVVWAVPRPWAIMSGSAREEPRSVMVLRSEAWVSAAPWVWVCCVPPPQCSVGAIQQVMVRW